MSRNTAAAVFPITLYGLWPAMDMISIETVLRLHSHFSYTSKEGFSMLLLVEVLHPGVSTILHNMV